MGNRKLPIIKRLETEIRWALSDHGLDCSDEDSSGMLKLFDYAMNELDKLEPAVGRCKTCDAFYAYQEPRYVGLGYCARGLTGINGDGSDYCSQHHPKPEATDD